MNLVFKALAIASAMASVASVASAQQGKQCDLTVHFMLNSDKLTADVEDMLRNFAAHYPAAHVYATGHTDELASQAYNIDLSRRRVLHVEDFLVHNGGEKMVFSTAWKGKLQPVVNTPKAEVLNRRVELIVDNCDPAVLANAVPTAAPAPDIGALTSGEMAAGIGAVAALAVLVASGSSSNSTASTTGTH